MHTTRIADDLDMDAVKDTAFWRMAIVALAFSACSLLPTMLG